MLKPLRIDIACFARWMVLTMSFVEWLVPRRQVWSLIQAENHGVAGGLWVWLGDSDRGDRNLDITYCCVRFIRKMACKKLTLSVPESTIRKAKVFAKRRNMSVSKLFSESIEKLAVLESEDPKLEAENPDLFAFLGVAESRLSAFDERSESILGKHG